MFYSKDRYLGGTIGTVSSGYRSWSWSWKLEAGLGRSGSGSGSWDEIVGRILSALGYITLAATSTRVNSTRHRIKIL